MRHISGGRVLDVATGQGGFLSILTQCLKDYTEIVGIDTSAQALRVARETLDAANVRFLTMDAERLEFDDESFDTISMGVSLHHLDNIPQVLKEIKRVLKPDGYLIITGLWRI